MFNNSIQCSNEDIRNFLHTTIKWK